MTRILGTASAALLVLLARPAAQPSLKAFFGNLHSHTPTATGQGLLTTTPTATPGTQRISIPRPRASRTGQINAASPTMTSPTRSRVPNIKPLNSQFRSIRLK